MATDEFQDGEDPETKINDKRFKKQVIFVAILIFFLVIILFIMEQTSWEEILLFFGILIGFGCFIILLIWPLLNVGTPSKLLKLIQEMEEANHTEYEHFDHTIKCKVYHPGMFLWTLVWGSGLYALVYAHIRGYFPDEPGWYGSWLTLIPEGLILFFIILIPMGGTLKNKDIIVVDPRNQTFIVYKNKLIFFHSRKKIIVPWNETTIVPYEDREEHLDPLDEDSPLKKITEWRYVDFHFGDKHRTYFEVVDNDDYREIVPKAFTLLTKEDSKDKLMAFKSLILYKKKFTIRMTICWIIALIFVGVESFFLIKYL